MKVPFNKEYYTGNEIDYIEDVLKKRGHTKGDGFYTDKVSKLLKNKFSAKKVFMTTSGTHALEMATTLLDLKPKDEVILPSFTFSSTANAVLKQQAIPVFADIEPKTLNLNPVDVKRKITDRTKAVIPIHYAGIAAAMDKLSKIANENDIKIIEDAAQAVNSKYKNKYLGTIGTFGCFSFHSTKNYISGEGGALLINKDDEELFDKASIIREKGTNRSKFIQGKVDKYTWVDQGSSYLPSDLLMAFLYAQLTEMDEIKKKRKKIFIKYLNELVNITRYPFIESITENIKNRESNYNSFYLIFNNRKYRDRTINMLQKRKITASFHYIPLHLSKMGKKLGYKYNDLPVTEKIADNIMRLPLYTGMTKQEVEYVIANLKEVLKELTKWKP